jgi:hypothetical protein
MNNKNSLKQQSGFFRHDDEGKMLFYPWGYPGESFYVEKKHKKQITVFFYAITPLFILTMLNITYLPRNGVTELDTSLLFITIAFSFFLILYWGFMRFFTKNLEFYIDENKEIPKGTIYGLLIILVLQIIFTAIGILHGHGSLLFTTMLVVVNGLYCLGLISLIIATYRNKGYYLTNKRKK